MSQKRLIVIGGGAAGIFCAVNAARMAKELKVIVLEKSQRLLSKVKVSGGGRCNVTHLCDDIRDTSGCYPRGKNFVKKGFHLFFTKDTIEWFEARGVPIVAESDGRMFPESNTSESIIKCLMTEANRYSVDFRMNCAVAHVEKRNELFVIRTASGEELESDYLCIACGGFPKVEQYHWIVSLGHSIMSPVPSLFTFNVPDNPITSLMGVAVQDAMIRINGTNYKERGPVLITHWGLSGPAVIRLSAWAARDLSESGYAFQIRINWVPEENPDTVRQLFSYQRQSHGYSIISSKNPFSLPQRLWIFLMDQSGIPESTRWSDLTSRQQSILIENICAQCFDISGKTTFKEEFVTAGGVMTNEINPQTMESRKLSSLYFAGEIMDVDGITGGYNFQHAWTSGWIAAQDIAAKTLAVVD
jgi:predicted Rossmann fold flavoprotein